MSRQIICGTVFINGMELEMNLSMFNSLRASTARRAEERNLPLIKFPLPARWMKLLPYYIYEPKSHQDDQPCCPICLENYKAKHIIRRLPCAHEFHIGCINEWLRAKITCPICRCDASANLNILNFVK